MIKQAHISIRGYAPKFFDLKKGIQMWYFKIIGHCQIKRLNKFSDEQFIQPKICAEASQICLIAE